MESVENLPQESDGQGATTGEDQEDGPETVMVAEHSRSQQDAAEAGLSKSDEGGGAETNIGVISGGVATGGEASVRIGGGGTVGMQTSYEAETQGAECTKSVGGDGELMIGMAGLMDEFIPGCDLMSEFIPEGTDRTGTRDDCGDSQEIMLSMNYVFKRDNGSAQESEASQEEKGSHMDNDGHMEAEETLDTRNVVVQGSEMDVNMLDKELMDGHVAQTIADTKNEEVQSPAHNDMGNYRCPYQQTWCSLYRILEVRYEGLDRKYSIGVSSRGQDISWEIRSGFAFWPRFLYRSAVSHEKVRFPQVSVLVLTSWVCILVGSTPIGVEKLGDKNKGI
jgi:hypothetical protein